MKRTLITIGLLLLVGAIMFASRGEDEMPEVDHVEYLGELIRTVPSAPAVEDPDDYHPIVDPAEAERVHRLVAHAPIADEFPSRWDLIVGIGRLKFPGYGMRQFGEKPQPDGTVLSGHGIEIPLSKAMRILVYRARDGHYWLIDDFVDYSGPHDDPIWPPGIASVVEEPGQLVYSNMKGERVATRPIARK